MRMRSVVSLALVWALAVLAGFAQTEGTRTSSGDASLKKGIVDVKSCVKVFIEKGRPAYSISYEYDFPGRSSVHVKGLGEVPAKGSLHYLSADKELEFSDPATKELLARVPLTETIIVAAKPPLNQVPGENEFPIAFRSYVWDSPKVLQERANAVLGQYFYYLPRESKGTVFLATTFTPIPLKGLPDGVLGQVALLISFPYDTATKNYSFHVQSLVKEGRMLSDEFRPTSSTVIVHSADAFVDSLIKEMKAGEVSKP